LDYFFLKKKSERMSETNQAEQTTTNERRGRGEGRGEGGRGEGRGEGGRGRNPRDKKIKDQEKEINQKNGYL